MFMENIGTLIRKRREKCKLKVFELAKKVGVSAVYITQIEKHNKIPPYDLFIKIENALGGLEADLYQCYLKVKFPGLLKDMKAREIIK